MDTYKYFHSNLLTYPNLDSAGLAGAEKDKLISSCLDHLGQYPATMLSMAEAAVHKRAWIPGDHPQMNTDLWAIDPESI